jgi:hypothetical protein
MKYQLLGKSGLRVSELCLGAMTFGALACLNLSSTSSLLYATICLPCVVLVAGEKKAMTMATLMDGKDNQ